MNYYSNLNKTSYIYSIWFNIKIVAYRNKCYACFDGDNDIHYYRLMTAWHANNGIDFKYLDAHSLTQARDTSTEATIKRSLRLRLNNTREFLVLIGNKTKNLHRFVRWEIEIALELDLPIIAINLNKKRERDLDLCPAILRNKLAIHIPFNQKIIDYALNNWPEMHYKYRKSGKDTPYEYANSIYEKLGL